MNLIRLLVIFLVGFLVYRMIRNRLETRKHKATSSEKLQNMVRCEVCGLHIPEHEALQQAGRYFCSEQHRKQDSQDS